MPDQHPRDTDPPSMGSVCEYLRGGRGDLPAYVYLPCWLGWGQAFRRAGPYAGFLGQRYDAAHHRVHAARRRRARSPSPGKPRDRPRRAAAAEHRVRRRPHPRPARTPAATLLEQFDDQLRRPESRPRPSAATTAPSSGRSTCSPRRGCATAFDLSKEDPRLLDRYGRTLFGHSTLIARRLVEEGVRFVNVTWDLFWDRVQIDYDAWDTHTKNFAILKDEQAAALRPDVHGAAGRPGPAAACSTRRWWW